MYYETCTRLAMLSALAILTGCSGGTGDEARVDPAANPEQTYALESERIPTGDAQKESVPFGADVELGPEGEYPGVAAADATPPVAPHSTQLIMREDGLYAHDGADGWRKFSNGSWTTVQAPQ